MGKLMAKLARALEEQVAKSDQSTNAPSQMELPASVAMRSRRPTHISAPQSSNVDDWHRLTQFASLLDAWRKVKANHGTAGVDGVTIEQFEKNLRANLEQLAKRLKQDRYEPQPVKRIYVPKPRGGSRPLAILAVQDRIVQRALYDVIAPRFEEKFLDCSFGFREGRSTQDAVGRVVELQQRGLHWVVDGDIKDCFENLEHRRLMRAVQEDIRDKRILSLIEQWLKAKIFNELDGRDVGTFQGGILSPLLANVYLHTFDVRLTQAHYNLVRYADDWLILCKNEKQAEAGFDLAVQVLEELRLAVNPYKTRIVSFEQGLQFVGRFFVRDENYPLSIAASESVAKRLMSK